MLNHARRRAAKLGIPFDLVQSDIIIPDRCPVLGILLSTTSGSIGPATPSLDRREPHRGYVRGNVFVISTRANRLKANASIEEIRAILAYMQRGETDV